MSASLIKFAVAVLASAVITGYGGGGKSSASNTAEQKSSDLPVAVNAVQSVDFSSISDENLANCIKENEITHSGVQVLVCADKGIQSLEIGRASCRERVEMWVGAASSNNRV